MFERIPHAHCPPGPSTPRARYQGTLLGLAAGDALGTTLEFTRPGTFEQPITDMIGGGPFRLSPGHPGHRLCGSGSRSGAVGLPHLFGWNNATF